VAVGEGDWVIEDHRDKENGYWEVRSLEEEASKDLLAEGVRGVVEVEDRRARESVDLTVGVAAVGVAVDSFEAACSVFPNPILDG
jgi:hypothetical protein